MEEHNGEAQMQLNDLWKIIMENLTAAIILKSKWTLKIIEAIIFVLVAKLIWQLSTEEIMLILALLMAFIVRQGLLIAVRSDSNRNDRTGTIA